VGEGVILKGGRGRWRRGNKRDSHSDDAHQSKSVERPTRHWWNIECRTATKGSTQTHKVHTLPNHCSRIRYFCKRPTPQPMNNLYGNQCVKAVTTPHSSYCTST